MPLVQSEEVRGALANKLRSVRSEETPTAPVPAPTAPGPRNPFEGATEPVVVTQPEFSENLPRKRIISQGDLEQFHRSPAFHELLGLIQTCNGSVRDRKLTEPIDESEVRRFANAAGECHPRCPGPCAAAGR